MTIVATFALLILLGASASSVAANSDSLEIIIPGRSILADLARGYQLTEQDLNAKLEQYFIDHNLGTPRYWSATIEGYTD